MGRCLTLNELIQQIELLKDEKEMLRSRVLTSSCGENSHRKLQNVVVSCTANRHHGDATQRRNVVLDALRPGVPPCGTTSGCTFKECYANGPTNAKPRNGSRWAFPACTARLKSWAWICERFIHPINDSVIVSSFGKSLSVLLLNSPN
jgi:hypothetical protein